MNWIRAIADVPFLGSSEAPNAYERRLVLNSNVGALVAIAGYSFYGIAYLLIDARTLLVPSLVSFAFVPFFVLALLLQSRGRRDIAPVLLMTAITVGLVVNVVYLIGPVLNVHYHFLLFAGVSVAFIGFRRLAWLAFFFLGNLAFFALAQSGVFEANPLGLNWLPETASMINTLSVFTIFSVACTILYLAEFNAFRSETELERQAATDSLTRLPNRRAFEQDMQRGMSRSQRSGETLTLILMDIDHFKRINDAHGHPVGDEVLVHFASLLQTILRVQDNCARIGGEEFAAYTVGLDAARAREVCDRLRLRVASEAIPSSVGAMRLTISLGVAFRKDDESYEQLYARADDALYRAKANGRNRVEWSD